MGSRVYYCHGNCDLNAALNASKCHESRHLSWWTGGRRLPRAIAEKIPVCMQMLVSY